jgi:uncharacterized protein YbjT (DUF2867 family)
MDGQGRDDEDGALRAQLDVHLDRRPVTGRLRTAQGADERFVGWLGFVAALRSVQKASERPPPTTQGGTMTENTTDQRPILVLGGTGKTGRRIVERLAAQGIPTRVGSRTADPAFDWEDQSTWAPALQDARAAYISYFPDLAVPGAPEAVRAFADVALAQGVRRLVLLSGRGEDEAQRAEQAVQDTGADVTVVRCAWFMQNFSEDYLLESILGGVVVVPATDQLEPFVDADDIADVAVAALTDDRHIGEVYELTSPRLMTFADAVGEIAEATGRDIRYVPISIDEYAAGAAEHGIYGEFLTYLFSEVLGRSAYVTDGVQRALGREPRDFREYARDTAATGTWNVGSAAGVRS